ncbi:MAG: class II aldolase/adducin family protein [Firmicutes bacterium]|nr:class II aldolase/adducin family protein [Bacillota bacterium]
MKKTIDELKEEIVRVAKAEYHSGMVNIFEGNISVRTDDRFLITPSQVSKETMTKDMIIEVDAAGNVLNDTGFKPSSELGMHLKVYELRKDVNAVVHNHSLYATAFAMNNKPIVSDSLVEVNITLGDVPVVPYGTPGTERIYKEFDKYIPDRYAVLLENHGVLSFGADLLLAYSYAEAVEKIAQTIFIADRIGSPVSLPEAELPLLREFSLQKRRAEIQKRLDELDK